MQENGWKILINKVCDFQMSKGITSFVNPYSMLILKERVDLAENVDFWHVDGISLVNELNRSFNKNINRFSFDDTSIAPAVFKFVKDKNLSAAIVGTKEEHIHEAVRNIEKKHQIEIKLYRNGYFESATARASYIDKIVSENIDVVICGMGTPYQELFLIDLKKSGWTGYGFTCGGYLHQIARKADYYPAFFNKLNIRWIYRIIDEPKLLRRYMIDYPNFFIKLFLFKRKEGSI